MLLGLGLLFVGAALALNGLYLLGHIQSKEIWVINFLSGGLLLLSALLGAFAPDAGRLAIFGGAQLLLFAFTYLWLGVNTLNGADGRGLGWFCLFVAVTAVPIAVATLMSGAPWWLGFNWTVWALTWFILWLLLAVGMTQLTRFTGYVAIVVAIVTGWVPGYLILSGMLPPPG